MKSPRLDRLAILTVSGLQVNLLMEHLGQEKFNFTVINSTGGMLQEPEVCLLVGFRSERLSALLDVVRQDCHPYRQYVSAQGFMQGEMANPPMVEVELGGARFYIMNVERFEQI
jgi:uncharacterized protein YaaQ